MNVVVLIWIMILFLKTLKKMVKLKKYRTCNGCKAYYYRFKSHHCSLGYRQKDSDKKLYGFSLGVVPDEKCTKPKTLSELSEAHNTKKLKSQ